MKRAWDGMVVEAYGYAHDAAPAAAREEWPFVELDAQGNLIEPAVETKSVPEAPQPEAPQIDWQQRLDEETQQSFQAGFDRGVQDGRATEREAQQKAHAAELERLASGVTCITGEFDAERNRYFERLEQEAARLALAIAARILRREAQMDPLLLLGAARVALGQLGASTEVRLRVPSADAELWKQALALLPNRDLKPEVIGDEDLPLANCILETQLGSADLGMSAQLGEIEREMFNRAHSVTVSRP